MILACVDGGLCLLLIAAGPCIAGCAAGVIHRCNGKQDPKDQDEQEKGDAETTEQDRDTASGT